LLEVKLTRACSDKPEFIVKAKIGDHLDVESLHKIMCDSRSFKNVTYLRKVGILRALTRSKSIMIFRDGRVTINCVRDAEEASAFIRFLIETLRLR
jgi:ArsR family metal-binding transcriptional regulator